MFCRSYSGSVAGIEGIMIQIEADVSEGLPEFSMVGFLSSEVREAKERVRIALKNLGFVLPPKKITINLSPADVKKEGTGYDLGIAMAVLAAFGYMVQESLDEYFLIGEVSLDGSVKRVNGILPIIHGALNHGFTKCLVPQENVKEASAISGMEVYGISSIKDGVGLMNGDCSMESEYFSMEEYEIEQEIGSREDFSDISGQEYVKRAVEIAVAGNHNLLMVGPPGSGKTMVAKRIPTIMPKMDWEECLKVSKVYSVAGILNNHTALIKKRPFRSPHHTITRSALAGGGHIPAPGEISLATGGVLFLDELAEFQNNTIEVLRQPLEEREITISRLNASYRFPADFMLVCAMNPCRCGHYPDRNKCKCSINEVNRYLGKVSKPLLDRIDICVEAPRVLYQELEGKKGTSSAQMKERIEKARQIQMNRYREEGIRFNLQLTPTLIKKYCILGKKEEELLRNSFEKYNMSARTYYKIIKIARTIADLCECENIDLSHIREALCYKNVDKKYWG